MSYNIVMIQDDVNKFLEYLEVDRGLSNNTLISYHFYLSRFVDFATSQGVHNVGQISQELIHRYRLYLNRLNNRQNENLKKNTQNYQQFVNLYPTSKNVAEANANIDELRLKLQRKDFETAKLYLKTEEYKSAVIAFNNLIKEYPDTQYKEEALYLIVKTYYDYAGKSVVQKKYERYKATIDAAANFIQLFPESNKYNKEIEQISKSASKEILKFKPQNS